MTLLSVAEVCNREGKLRWLRGGPALLEFPEGAPWRLPAQPRTRSGDQPRHSWRPRRPCRAARVARRGELLVVHMAERFVITSPPVAEFAEHAVRARVPFFALPLTQPRYVPTNFL